VSISAFTRSPVLVVVAPIDSRMASWLVRGRPRQFVVTCEESWCSILFQCVLNAEGNSMYDELLEAMLRDR
jgi:hypothetical protein